MPKARMAGVVAFVERLFPHRQFYLRTRGAVQFFELSPAFQITVSLGALFAVLWIFYATVVVVFKEQLIAGKDSRYAHMRAAYDRKVLEMQQAQDELSGILVFAEERFQNATRDLALRHRQMTQLLMKKQAMAKRLREVRRRVAAMSDYRGSGRLATASPDGANTLMVQALPADPAPRRGRLPQSAGGSTIRTIQVSLKGHTKNVVIKNIGLLEERLAVLQKQQLALLDDVHGSLVTDIERYARIMKMAGVPMAQATAQASASGSGEGGPVRLGPLDLRFEQEFGKLEEAFDKLDGLTTMLARLPLVTPIASGFYNSTSGYGHRIDPINGRYAFHSGADLGSEQGTSVLASAAGVVRIAERYGAYGNTVEIDHGQGIRTRYGHLQAILVKRGDRVHFQQKVGTVGSTGRSTGPHLHYEIWINGVHRDPTKFFEAGRRVYMRQ